MDKREIAVWYAVAVMLAVVLLAVLLMKGTKCARPRHRADMESLYDNRMCDRATGPDDSVSFGVRASYEAVD